MERMFANFSINPNEVGIPTTELSSATVASVTDTVLFWGGSLAVIVIIIAGIIYATSSDDETRVRRAKATILFAVIGLGVMLLAWAIVKLVGGALS